MEVAPSHRHVPVTESSQPAAARYATRDAADTAGFSEEDSYRAGLVATELATNLVKHAINGEILVRRIRGSPTSELEVISIDRGPGMADVSRNLSDGYSTAGTAGTGLGAIRRLADEFDIYTHERGTVIVTRLRAKRADVNPLRPLQIAGVSVAKKGETVCGDAWQADLDPGGAVIVVGDGLGHGLLAWEASSAAVMAVDSPATGDLAAVLRKMHDGLRHTRGAAAAVLSVRLQSGLVRFGGVGNISASLVDARTVRHMVSSNGTLGHEAHQFREYSYSWAQEATLVVHSDGLGTHWSLDAYRGIRQRHPATIAAVLYRDFSRHRDDVTVVVGRARP